MITSNLSKYTPEVTSKEQHCLCRSPLPVVCGCAFACELRQQLLREGIVESVHDLLIRVGEVEGETRGREAGEQEEEGGGGCAGHGQPALPPPAPLAAAGCT